MWLSSPVSRDPMPYGSIHSNPASTQQTTRLPGPSSRQTGVPGKKRLLNNPPVWLLKFQKKNAKNKKCQHTLSSPIRQDSLHESIQAPKRLCPGQVGLRKEVPIEVGLSPARLC